MKNLETYDGIVAINVDIQNDFLPGGALPVENGDEVIEPMNRLNRWTRDNNGLVVFTRDWHPTETSHFDNWPAHCIQYKSGAAFPDGLEVFGGTDYFTNNGRDLVLSKGFKKDTDGYSGMDAEMQSDVSDRGWSSAQNMSLKYFLRTKYIHGYFMDERWNKAESNQGFNNLAIVIGGLATDYCVRATVLDALKLEEDTAPWNRHIGVFAVTDAMRTVDVEPGDGNAALKEMEVAGANLVTTDEILTGKAFLLPV